MKFMKKAIFLVSVGALASIGAMSLLNCDKKEVNDIKKCSMLKKLKSKIGK